MLKERRERQRQMDLVILEQLIPENHLLRKVEHAVDFSFIYPLCAPLYCEENGRPAIDPEVLFRMLFIGYLYGIKSEARPEEEVNYNMAYKWFCGLGLTEKAPDASTISQNRRRRFRDNNIAEQIFNEILRQCIAKGLVRRPPAPGYWKSWCLPALWSVRNPRKWCGFSLPMMRYPLSRYCRSSCNRRF